jgi:hypothetical protein
MTEEFDLAPEASMAEEPAAPPELTPTPEPAVDATAPEPAPVVEKPKKQKKAKQPAAPKPERLPNGHSPEPTEAPDSRKSGIATQLYGAAKLKAKFLRK